MLDHWRPRSRLERFAFMVQRDQCQSGAAVMPACVSNQALAKSGPKITCEYTLVRLVTIH